MKSPPCKIMKSRIPHLVFSPLFFLRRFQFKAAMSWLAYFPEGSMLSNGTLISGIQKCIRMFLQSDEDNIKERTAEDITETPHYRVLGMKFIHTLYHAGNWNAVRTRSVLCRVLVRLTISYSSVGDFIHLRRSSSASKSSHLRISGSVGHSSPSLFRLCMRRASRRSRLRGCPSARPAITSPVARSWSRPSA